LFGLAGVALSPPTGPPRAVRPYVAGLLDRLPDTAVIVTAASYDVIAWNPLAGALLGDLRGQPNLARRRFLFREEVLTTGHEEFREIWATNPVRAAGHRTKPMSHPELGPLRIICDVLAVPDDDQQVVFMTADPERLKRLRRGRGRS
jgi:hypothetical protein